MIELITDCPVLRQTLQPSDTESLHVYACTCTTTISSLESHIVVVEKKGTRKKYPTAPLSQKPGHYLVK